MLAFLKRIRTWAVGMCHWSKNRCIQEWNNIAKEDIGKRDKFTRCHKPHVEVTRTVCPPHDNTGAMILLKKISETSKISNGEKCNILVTLKQRSLRNNQIHDSVCRNNYATHYEGRENTKHSVMTFAITRSSTSETAQETCCIAIAINMKTIFLSF